MILTRRAFVIGAASAGATAFSIEALSRGGVLAPAAQPQRKTAAGRLLDVREAGARGDGSGDDRVAIQSAIDRLAALGGGTLLFPAGTYVVSRTADAAVALRLRSGVTLEGQGSGSVIKLHDGSGGHLVSATSESNCGVRNLTLDGNRANQTSSGHGLRCGGVAGLRVLNVTVRDAFSYGIGIEAGTNRDMMIDRVIIQDCGADGIDIKNKNSGNSDVTIRNVTVRRWGLRGDKQTQAGIDCRGRVRLENISISEPGARDAVGIRMRHGELGSANGLGGHGSSLNGFDVRMGAGRAQVGVDVAARTVLVTNGSISGGRRGLQVHESGFRASNVRVKGCSETGILIDAHGRGLDGDGAVLSQCSAEDCGADGILVEADAVQILNCTGRSNGASGVAILETADGTRVVGGDYSGNRSGRISNRGSRSVVAVAVN